MGPLFSLWVLLKVHQFLFPFWKKKSLSFVYLFNYVFSLYITKSKAHRKSYSKRSYSQGSYSVLIKFAEIQDYTKKWGTSQVNNLTFHLKELENKSKRTGLQNRNLFSYKISQARSTKSRFQQGAKPVLGGMPPGCSTLASSPSLPSVFFCVLISSSSKDTSHQG